MKIFLHLGEFLRVSLIPFSVRRLSLELNLSHLPISDLAALGISVGVQLDLHRASFGGAGGGNQVDHCFVTDQGLALPVVSKVTKHPVFNLVPQAGSRRE